MPVQILRCADAIQRRILTLYQTDLYSKTLPLNSCHVDQHLTLTAPAFVNTVGKSALRFGETYKRAACNSASVTVLYINWQLLQLAVLVDLGSFLQDWCITINLFDR